MEFIADFYYDHRLREIENGLPVRRLSIYLGHNGDYFQYIGNNTGLIAIKKIEDLIDRFGKPVDIDFDTLILQQEWSEWLGFIDDKDLSFRKLQELKHENTRRS